MSRLQRSDLPRTNKGNSDAACHKMSNKDLIAHLTGAIVTVDTRR